MFFKFKRLKTGMVVALAMLSLPVAGQDLLARQAPIDKKMRAVDSVALQRLISNEQLDNPAFGLYPDWNNQYAHRYDGVELPEEYKIDLRHFCMPTTSRNPPSNITATAIGNTERFCKVSDGFIRNVTRALPPINAPKSGV